MEKVKYFVFYIIKININFLKDGNFRKFKKTKRNRKFKNEIGRGWRDFEAFSTKAAPNHASINDGPTNRI